MIISFIKGGKSPAYQNYSVMVRFHDLTMTGRAPRRKPQPTKKNTEPHLTFARETSW